MDQILNYFGYVATLFLIISLVVNNDLKFRWANGLGCLFFVIYAIYINAWPVILTNAILLAINIYYLINIYRKKEAFDFVEIKNDDPLLDKFLLFHQKEIQEYYPNFSKEKINGNSNFFVLRDLAIANFFSIENLGDGKGLVEINFTIPKYRDYKVGPFIFEKMKSILLAKGIKEIVYQNMNHKGHIDFLKKMKFSTENEGDYHLKLNVS